MRIPRTILVPLLAALFSTGMAQESWEPPKWSERAWLEPLELGVRLDDNVFRTDQSSGRLLDAAYLIDWGGGLEVRDEVLRALASYRLSTDQFQVHNDLNNQRHLWNLSLSAEPDDWTASYHLGLQLRSSRSPDYDYLDLHQRISVHWTPQGPWGYEVRFSRSTKKYFDPSTQYRSRGFLDNAITFEVQREVGDRFTLGLGGTLNLREFDRRAVDPLGLDLAPPENHLDQAWTLRLHARLFFASVLQDIVLEQMRTESNSHGFSNSARSLSWAAVVRPMDQLYLQLLGRIYWKAYDLPPIPSPDLQVGFVDEDGQEVLSARVTWEWTPQWMLNIGVSRVRNESTQPGVFYIKNLLTVQVRREF